MSYGGAISTCALFHFPLVAYASSAFPSLDFGTSSFGHPSGRERSLGAVAENVTRPEGVLEMKILEAKIQYQVISEGTVVPVDSPEKVVDYMAEAINEYPTQEQTDSHWGVAILRKRHRYTP